MEKRHTISEVHRELYKLLKKEKDPLIMLLLRSAFEAGKKMDNKIRQYQNNYDLEWWEKNRLTGGAINGLDNRPDVGFELFPPEIQKILCDNFVVSYPKAGRTWLKILLVKYFQLHFGLKIKERAVFTKPHAIRKETGNDSVPIIKFEHMLGIINDIDNGKDWAEKLNIMNLSSAYRLTNVVLLCRDPRAILVSMYFHQSHRLVGKYQYKGPLTEFIYKNECLDRIIKYYNAWAEYKHVPKNFLLIRYEDLYKDTKGVLKLIVEFLGIENINENHLIAAVKFASFNSMKKMERANIFGSGAMGLVDKDDNESFKVRQGKIDGYLDYLSDDDLVFINKKMEKLNPFFGYNK